MRSPDDPLFEPLIYRIARRALPLIAEAWGVPEAQLSYRSDGPREMAHHFLKIEFTLTFAQVAAILNTSGTTAQVAVKRGEHLYQSWSDYQQRYNHVKESLASEFL